MNFLSVGERTYFLKLANITNAFRTANHTNNMAEIIYKDLCKEIYGILFKIQNDLGTNFQERHYGRALEGALTEKSTSFKKEVPINIKYNNKFLGQFFADFIILDKIIVELKTTNEITPDHIKQMLRYLQATNLKLGLIVNFRVRPLKPVRVLNSHYLQA